MLSDTTQNLGLKKETLRAAGGTQVGIQQPMNIDNNEHIQKQVKFTTHITNDAFFEKSTAKNIKHTTVLQN